MKRAFSFVGWVLLAYVGGIAFSCFLILFSMETVRSIFLSPKIDTGNEWYVVWLILLGLIPLAAGGYFGLLAFRGELPGTAKS